MEYRGALDHPEIGVAFRHVAGPNAQRLPAAL